MISEQKIAEVRQAARISEFISPYVTLKRSGRGLIGLCPFHGEKSPSFSVSDEGGFYHCFGCSAGGNVFKFVMQMENLSFPEAVRKVAAHYGIEVPDEGGNSGATSERDAMFAILTAATRFFRDSLAKSPAGQAARTYLDQRGVDPAARERFALGASPAGGDGLVQALKRERHDLRVAERLGLVGMRGGSTYDRFRGRVMFPIRDPQGRTLGFGARRLGEGEGPKYLNSSDSMVYHKGRVLYGLFEAREAERGVAVDQRSDELILVEGYLDVIAMSQAGIPNVVAGCGTALTPDQTLLMRLHASEVVALYDGDDAGRRAAARSFPVFLEAGLWARGVFLPQDEDPDTFVKTHGAAALKKALASAVPLVEAYVREISTGAGTGAAGAARAGTELAEVLRKVDNPFEYDLMVKKAALWTGISEQVLREQSRAPSRPTAGRAATPGPDREPGAPRPAAPRAKLPAGPPGAEELLVSVLLADPGCVDRLAGRDIVSLLTTEPWAGVAAAIFDAAASASGYQPGDVLAELDDALRGRLVGRLVDDPTFSEPAARERVLADCLARLEAVAAKERKRRELAELRRLEEQGDEAGVAALLARRAAIRKTE